MSELDQNRQNVGQHLEKGLQHHQSGEFTSAEAIYREILQKQPENADALHLLGLLTHQKGDPESASKLILRAISSNPNAPAFHNSCGEAFRSLGKLDEAIKCYSKALELSPNDAFAHNNLGNALFSQDKIDHAILAYCSALEINPNLSQTHFNLGRAYFQKGISSKAIAHYQEAIRIQNHFPEAYNELGNALKTIGRVDEAISAYSKSIEQNPSHVQTQSNRLLALHYSSQFSQAQIFKEHLLWGEKNTSVPQPLRNRFPDECLRIGYVSPDFRKHVVATFIEPILENHDRSKFKIYCYANQQKNDEVTKLLTSLSDAWRDISKLNDEEAFKLIQEDQIDILVDLAGHTTGNRLILFSKRPAPIQATYLGYPNTTGLMSIEFRLTDAYADPLGMTDPFHSEKLIRLSHTNWCYRPTKKMLQVSDLPALTKGYITFGSFNNVTKITSETIELWSKILKRIPNSRILMNAREFRESETKQYFENLFIRQGIDSDRLTFSTWEEAVKSNIYLYHKVDIGLDTFPYHGTTTTCELLWMGIPVISLAGKSHVSRVGVSLLSNSGLQECIAHTPDEYLSISDRLSNDFHHLSKLRSGLRGRMQNSPLTNGLTFTRDLEDAYHKMWDMIRHPASSSSKA